MKNIVITNLKLKNFKGIESLELDFNSNTDVYGANGSGKTTIFDAFTWLLFGKDSQDRKDFDIKPLDTTGNQINKIENEVEGSLLVNNEVVILKRIHREKWVKKRGSEEAEFTGNETVYFWNDVPMNAKEYIAKINDLLDESVFKLISNPLAFNNLKWQDRRNVLIDIAGDYKVDYISNNLEHILQLTEKKTIAELKAEVNSKVKKIKEELKLIPTRIDEVQKSKPETPDVNQITNDLNIWQKELEKIDSQILDASKSNEEVLKRKTDLQNKIFELKSQIKNIEFEHRNKANQTLKADTSKVDALQKKFDDAKFEYQNALSRIKQLESKRDLESEQLSAIETRIITLRKEWQEVNAKEITFNDNDFHCPTCKREFESGDVDSKKAELIANFNTKKANQLNEINQQGLRYKTEKESLESSIAVYTKRVVDGETYANKCKSDVDNLHTSLELEKAVLDVSKSTTTSEHIETLYNESLRNDQTYNSLVNEVSAHEMALIDIKPIEYEDLIQLKKQTTENIDVLKKQLSVLDQIESANKRIQELKDEESKYSKSLLELEKQEFDIEKFIKLGIESLEKTINEKFKFVKFKLFDTQINGGQVECCEALIEGVPFNGANTASKINAGLDIINSLCDFYNVSAPIFIDNRESVSELIETKSQIINLIVNKEYKKLKVVA